MRGHKYNAKRVDGCPSCGQSHPSQKEAKRCGELHLLQRAGEIADLKTQVRYPLFGMGGKPLLSAERKSDGWRKPLTMTWDFAYIDAHGRVVEDSKGMALTDFQLRRSVFEDNYPDTRTVIS